MERISIASLGKPFGVKGEVNAFSMTDFPKLRFKIGESYFLANDEGEVIREVTLSSFRFNGPNFILGFKEIATPEEMGKYRNLLLEMDKAKAPVPEGRIRYADIIGFKVINEEGNELGSIQSIRTDTLTPNIKVEKPDHKTFYVPFNDFFVKKVDAESHTLTVHEIGGLLG